jgi:hypothetical protein
MVRERNYPGRMLTGRLTKLDDATVMD